MTKAPKAAPAPAGALSTDDLALAAQHVELLREIHGGDHATKTDLAKHLGRDLSNLNKTLKILAEAGLAHAEGIGGGLPDKGQRALKAIDKAAGAASDEPGSSGQASSVVGLLHRQIIPDPKQARKDWDSAEAKKDLAELADDVVDKGVLQNLLVRAPDAVLAFLPDDPAALAIEEGLTLYMLDGGERRWRAVGLAIADGRWPADRPIDCRIIESDALGHKLVGLAENLQRRSLNPIEKAEAFEDLAITGGLSNAEIAAKVKSTPEHVQQHRRFLKLSKADQARMVLPRDDERHLSVRGARALLAEIAAREEKLAQLQALPADLKLAAAEMLHAIATRGRYSWADIAIRPHGAESELGKEMARRDWARFSDIRTYGDTIGHHTVMRGYGTPNDLAPWVNSPEAAVRDEGLAQAQEASGLTKPAEALYITDWLNEPTEISAEGQKIIDEAAERKAASDAANADRAAKEAEAKAATQKARAAAVELFERERVIERTAAAPSVVETMTAFGHPLPWAITVEGTIVDANRQTVDALEGGGWHSQDRDRSISEMTVLAVNAAGGFATGPAIDLDAEEAELEKQREGFLALMAAELVRLRTDTTAEQAAEEVEDVLDQFLIENTVAFGADGWSWDEDGAKALIAEHVTHDDAPESEAA